jgi:hydrogenase-4 component F
LNIKRQGLDINDYRTYYYADTGRTSRISYPAERSAPGPAFVVGNNPHLSDRGLLVLQTCSGPFRLADAGCSRGFVFRHNERYFSGRFGLCRRLSGSRRRRPAEKVFTGTLLFFLAAMTLVAVSQHFGLLWVAVEATTLASAPLIYFHRHHRSLEATWKYLLICSVGIALALLGNFFLAVAASVNDGSSVPLVLNDMLRLGTHFNIPWLKAAFLFLLVGYGTKMGLAPLHTWLPDAHSEAPSVVSALLSGALLNCAFLGILRAQQVLNAAGQAAFGRELLLLFGLASMAVAAVFIVSQADYKRMLAYSSVEHMGILSIGIGLGGTGAFGAMLHAVNHSVTKAMLFLVAGNILTAFRTKRVAEVQGVLGILPVSGVLWVGGFLAITGSPPFGPFLSEFTIFKAAVDGGNGVAAVVYLILLALIFIGMITAALRMAQGAPEKVAMNVSRAEGSLSIASPLALALLILLLGVYIPPPLRDILREAARVVGG